MINSVNNERVKLWSKLKDKKYRDETGLFLAPGEHLVEEAYKKGLITDIVALEGTDYPYSDITFVSEEVMNKINPLNSSPKIIGIARKIIPKPLHGNVLLLDGVQDPGNLGTIMRSAAAFNIGTIIIGDGSVDIYNPKVVRASEGMIFHTNIIFSNLKEIIPTLKENDYTVYATKVEGGTSLKKVTFSSKSAIIMGNEGAGVSSEALALADENIYIDMDKKCESLNVGIAASIILYELFK